MKAEFNDYAQNYRKNLDKDLSITGGTSLFFAQYKAKKLQEFTSSKVTTPQRILDFGCGDGLMTNEVAKLFPNAQVHGVDPSSEIIALAKKICPTGHFQTSEKSLDIFQGKKFDIVFAAMVFHHIPFEEHAHYIREITNILAPGGLFVIFELNPFNPIAQYIINTAKIDENAKILMPWYTTRLLKPYGLIKRKYCAYLPAFLKGLFPLEKYLEAIPLRAFSVTILEKK